MSPESEPEIDLVRLYSDRNVNIEANLNAGTERSSVQTLFYTGRFSGVGNLSGKPFVVLEDADYSTRSTRAAYNERVRSSTISVSLGDIISISLVDDTKEE